MQEITWTNCADEMPPETGYKIIVSDRMGYFRCQALILVRLRDRLVKPESRWTPYTDEKWKELNK